MAKYHLWDEKRSYIESHGWTFVDGSQCHSLSLSLFLSLPLSIHALYTARARDIAELSNIHGYIPGGVFAVYRR